MVLPSQPAPVRFTVIVTVTLAPLFSTASVQLRLVALGAGQVMVSELAETKLALPVS